MPCRAYSRAALRRKDSGGRSVVTIAAFRELRLLYRHAVYDYTLQVSHALMLAAIAAV